MKSNGSSVRHSGRQAKAHSQEACEQVIDSARRGELVVVAGAGVSVALSDQALPSWVDLISNGLSHCLKKGKLSESQYGIWCSHLQSDDMDELLGVAEFMTRKLDGPQGDLYVRWLQDSFRDAKATNQQMAAAIRAIRNANVPICTLNYDSLLEDVTGLPTLVMNDTAGVAGWMRGERQGILHLHGSWEVPHTCILSIRDYQTTLGNEVRELIQRSLGAFRRLIFVGCGATLNDPNFSALIRWLRLNISAAQLQHYALVPTPEIAARHRDQSWHGFVEPVGYGENFSDLPEFIKKHFSFGAQPRAQSIVKAANVQEAEVLDHYRRFLVKDCGQMTIEGIKADMDTSKQKFDIERLFVPLNVLPCPPDFPPNDPERHGKLAAWLEANKEPVPFGRILLRNKRLALLALPGGGKTMLLKRLAVAYADPQRRKIASDLLPKRDLFPVLIRCREWRDHIRSPIPTLLKSLPDITGQANLAGFADALIPLLKKGRVLLLVDGLDEIHNNADRTTFVEHLESFLEEYESIRLVVTSREAGFSLVAPCLTRFCEKFRVAPLDAQAITMLCHHWHLLMTGDSPKSLAEGRALAECMLNTTALRRLAENPLLLTMLLVVKHGAGRLPPDRVSLYGRAVEVLLDTWNIKGHEALNLKEAVPQLACVAFELMRQGKQTATESELLTLLQDARKKLPQIGRYAKDSPYEFLKRVELRSSLLLEAGHQLEGGQTVPFYQFRHLTFQEYLAAVAAVNGHFIGYRTNNTVLTPLQPFLTREEWKEVIPMAAVLAGKQAEPLVEALVARGKQLSQELIAERDFQGKSQWVGFPSKLPAPVARLTQCLIEEAEASQEILPDTLQLIVLFARGCRSEDDWIALSRGPYGDELRHQAWRLYSSMNWPEEAWIRNTCAALCAKQHPMKYWLNAEGIDKLRRKITSDLCEDIGMGLLSAVGILTAYGMSGRRHPLSLPMREIENLMFREDPELWHAAAWLWALYRYYGKSSSVPGRVLLDRFIELWTREANGFKVKIMDFVISQIGGIPREAWTPSLSQAQRGRIEEVLGKADNEAEGVDIYSQLAAIVIAFYARDVVSDSRLADVMAKPQSHIRREVPFKPMLMQMGEVGQKYLRRGTARKKAAQKSC